ncbi:MAG: hypothetical protein WC002_05620, partial [Candidatus Muiribacteriota bacterium]
MNRKLPYVLIVLFCGLTILMFIYIKTSANPKKNEKKSWECLEVSGNYKPRFNFALKEFNGKLYMSGLS